MDTICYRCGMCCHGYLAAVPKTTESNLSPGFLSAYEAEHGDKIVAYVYNNAVMMSDPCQWLIKNEDGTTTCSAYCRRSSDCRNYPGTAECKVGKQKMV